MSKIEPKVDYTPLKTNKTKGQIYEVACQQCDRNTRHLVICGIWRGWEYDGMSGSENYEIIQCQGCVKISFRETEACSEDEDEYGGYKENESLYPKRIPGRKLIEDNNSLPTALRQSYIQTHTALCSSLNVLAGAGIRILIETVCLDQGAKSRNLYDKINDLVLLDVLTKSNAKILHETGIMGNLAAHGVEKPSDNNLSIAMDIVEVLLMNVYIIPEKATKLTKKRV